MKKIRDVFIKPETSIKQSLRRMDEAGKRILFVIDNRDTILGVATDGDIRRWILQSNSLNENITKAMNKKPVLLKEGYSKEEAKEIMLSQQIECIPIIDENKKLISAIWWLDIFGDKFKKLKSVDLPVVIMAGGEGTRQLPFTNVLPKPLMPIGGKPIIELIIEKFMEFGCKPFYLSINYKANLLKAYFNDYKHVCDINYIQEEKPLGTAGSLFLLKDIIKNTFFVKNCDILVEADYFDILKFHKTNKNKITLIASMKHYTIPYGICKIENGGLLKGIEEKPEYDFLVNSGMYLIEQEVLQDIPENRFYDMTDLLKDYIKRDKKIGVYPVSEKSWFDIGQWEEL